MKRIALAVAVNGRDVGNGFDAILYDDGLLLVITVSDGTRGYAKLSPADMENPKHIVSQAASAPGDWVEIWENEEEFNSATYDLDDA